MTFQEQLPFLGRLAKGLAELFGDHCEVMVHDLSKDYEHTIVVLENGHITGRRVGDGASGLVLQALKEGKPQQDRYNYLVRTKEGRILKCSTIFIYNEKGQPSGLLGINYDITDLIMARHTVDAVIGTDEPEDSEKIGSMNTTVNDVLNQLIKDADSFVGKPVAMMGKEDKIRAIQFLNDKGAFLIKKAGDKVSKHYDISKYTLYNYMGAES